MKAQVGIHYYNRWHPTCEAIRIFSDIPEGGVTKGSILLMHLKIFNKNTTKLRVDVDREATPEEIQWFEACNRAGKYMSLEEALQAMDNYSITF